MESRLFSVDVKSPAGLGNRTSIEEKIANPRGCARGGDRDSKN